MSTEPGWYPDPAAPETQRYWDGEQWLGEPLPVDATPPDTPPAPPPDEPAAGGEAGDLIPPGMQLPTGMRLPPGLKLPPGTQLPPGLLLPKPTMPDGFTGATLERRLGARVFDVLLVGVLCVLANGWLGYRYLQRVVPYVQEAMRDPNAEPPTDSGLSTMFYSMVLITLAVWFAYEVLATSHSGQTLGKRLLRVKVVTMDGGAVGFRASLRRWMVMVIPCLFPCCLPLGLIDLLWCTWDRPLAQCIHDKSARTVVVSARPGDLPVEADGADSGNDRPEDRQQR